MWYVLPWLVLGFAQAGRSTLDVVVKPAGKIVLGDAMPRNRLGGSVAIQGTLVAVGAPYERRTGVNAGAAYIYEQPPGGRRFLRQRLMSPNGASWRLFGRSVAFSEDTLIVGAPGNVAGTPHPRYTGSVLVFERDSAGYWLSEELVPMDARTNDEFGYAVAIDGDTLVAGAHRQAIPPRLGGLGGDDGAAYVFTRGPGGTWTEVAKLGPFLRDETFGDAVAIERGRIVVGASSSKVNDRGGTAYVFERGRDGLWRLDARLIPRAAQTSDAFGVSLSLEGSKLVVGAGTTPSYNARTVVNTFLRGRLGSWVEQSRLLLNDSRGWGHVSLKNDVLAVGSVGKCQVFVWSDSRGWLERAALRPDPPLAASSDAFGREVYSDGKLIGVTATLDDDAAEDAGAVYLYSIGSRR